METPTPDTLKDLTEAVLNLQLCKGYAATSSTPDDGGSLLLAALKGDGAQDFDRPSAEPKPAAPMPALSPARQPVPKPRPAPLGAAVTAPG